MYRCFWFVFTVCLCPIILSAQAPDSTFVREITTGVYAHIESISDKVFSSNEGYAFELGAYQQRKLLGKVGIAYGAGFGYRSYDDTAFLIDTTPDNDTTIIDYFFQTRHDELKFSTGISVKFEYMDNPKIYLLIGLGPEITFRQRVAPVYVQTRYLGNPDNVTNEVDLLGTSTTDPPIYTEEDFNINTFNLRLDIGIGIELKNINIEIVNRTNNVQGIGIRLKYKFDTLVY